ncbi:MAG: penicillin-binding transpeptidase domain-containing protein [Blastocatellia bacterium]|nr:penicillin-binding transpeptidase domain-containing protein [Blastocatellia bacterium]MCS7157351.1 penicillin-binding transpeptidase domain-containing protein [Blastocatellia bacterium]MCX7753217.1 penicillin-binding transpeptidase domain-containing protein [Blastocatellia bacterium]MDW8168256.1 penicillin-binding transpeptidase domain-containing protein [Acidobacteriota bacterium]MDW8255451.1 penicillin-binding transpeptidase domain-containing protein [Acidobacteriota bacterium]
MRKRTYVGLVGLLFVFSDLALPAHSPERRSLLPLGSLESEWRGWEIQPLELLPQPPTSRRSRPGTSRASQRQRARRRAQRQAALQRRLARLDASVRRTSAAAIQRDDLRGEDPEVREAVLAALRGHAGTAVVMDPFSGRVYSIVNQEWALRKGFKPCSTIKLVVGLAGLNEGLIEARTPLPLGGGSIAMNLIEALAHSNNQYFEIIGEQLGRATLLQYAREWGLGQPTGINLPRESAGQLPSERPPAPRGRRAMPAVGRMASHGDGFAVTALQLAVLTSALVNGGTFYRPYVVQSEAERPTPTVRRYVNLPAEHRESLIAGMIAAVEYGTAKLAYVPGISFAGKTGSCRSDSLWLGLFTSFAPVTNPRFVVTVIVYGRHERGSTAASIVGQIYQRLAHRLTSPPMTESLRESRLPDLTPSRRFADVPGRTRARCRDERGAPRQRDIVTWQREFHIQEKTRL